MERLQQTDSLAFNRHKEVVRHNLSQHSCKLRSHLFVETGMKNRMSVRRALLDILGRQDLVFVSSSAHYAEKLSALCPGRNSEIQLVLAAFDADVVSELQRLGRRQIPSILLPKMMNWLQRESVLTEEEARWSVHSWAMALGLIEFAEEPVPAPEAPHCL